MMKCFSIELDKFWQIQEDSDGKISTGLKPVRENMSEWSIEAVYKSVVCALMAASFLSLSGAYIERERTSEKRSYIDREAIVQESMEVDEFSDVLSYLTNSIDSVAKNAYNALQTGVKAIGKHRSKALVTLLALQNSDSSFQLPGAHAVIVTNINQNLTYNPDLVQRTIPLLPISLSDTPNPCNASIVLTDINSGTLTSTVTGVPQKFSAGEWTAGGSRTVLNTLLANLVFTRAVNYRNPISLTAKIYDVMMSNSTATGYARILEIIREESARPVGTIQCMPLINGTTYSATNAFSQDTTTYSLGASLTSAPSSDNSQVTMQSSQPTSSISSTQSTLSNTESNTISSIPTQPTQNAIPGTVSSSLQSSSSSPLVTTTSRSQDEIIGGITGGVVLCCIFMAGLVAYRIHQHRGQKKSAAAEYSRELGIQPPQHGVATQSSDNTGSQYRDLPKSAVAGTNEIVPPIPYAHTPLGPNVTHTSSYRALPDTAHRAPLALASAKSGYMNMPQAPQSPPRYEAYIPPIKGANYTDTYSTMHKAAQKGECDLIDLHLSLGVAVDAVDADGFTPLQLAARAGHKEAVEFLLKHGADRTLCTREGKTPRMLAQEKGFVVLAELL